MEPPLPVSSSPHVVSHFCIFNAEFGPTEETQHEQLLYYTARQTTPIDVKMRQVGLAQALVNFTKVFSPDQPCENVHSQKNRLVFFEPEPGYWMTLNIELAKKVRPSKKNKEATIVNYQDTTLDNRMISEVLKQSYKLYKLLYGTFASTVAKQSVKALRLKLEEFYSARVWQWDFNQFDLFNIIDGIVFHPLSKSTFLHARSFVDDLQANFRSISNAFIMWDGQVVWTGLPGDDDIRAVYHYLREFLFNTSDLKKVIRSTNRKEKKPTSSLRQRGAALLGSLWSANSSAANSPVPSESEHLPADSKFLTPSVDLDNPNEPYNKSCTICLFFPCDEGTELDLQYLNSLDEWLRPGAQELSNKIQEDWANYCKIREEEKQQYYFIHYNKLNLAIRTQDSDSHGSSVANSDSTNPIVITAEMKNCLNNLREDLLSNKTLTEMIVRHESGFWVAGKNSEEREFYVIIHKKTMSLHDVEEEIRKLSPIFYGSIFLD
ncbi:hypothetical protein K493DRAFT_315914 [Basidiobolus meristosporus CBS 931.73]|uniref:CCZ1/INTU/HSP4 first Longin domain-containing protein n=1 Tax=Basidiobolus meristosporus CBS 931.73 TaxID=1314790 RepID=A0A1Y1Y6G1_9FUNG|nr:hypothetical protein K493DRAFT_315914 [Basidiobolus meristosporus CBS 931.73]|eukprot:ORX93602.1 hypothetical protein K493DRAFT_315914 [Basidiobolus meristosporus CBS 931.73]